MRSFHRSVFPLFSSLVFASLVAAPLGAADSVPLPVALEYGAGAGPGKGKHIVFLAGDEEYRSEEGLPMLAKILSQRHGFKCTVLLPVDPSTGEINPNDGSLLPGSEALDSADAIVMLLRYRAWPDEAMTRFEKSLKSGVPIVALRTSTHAFKFPEGSRWATYNDFGERVLGEEWVSHWGRHKEEATRGVLEQADKGNPILRGVEEVFGDSDVYEVYPPADARILLRGQVLAGMSPDSPPADYSKTRASDRAEQGVNDPMMPIAWTREYTNEGGKTNKIFCTTMGAATDLASEGLRRLIVNAVYWGVGLDVPRRANVDTVGEFRPTPYGFDGFQRGLRPSDFELVTVDNARRDETVDASANSANRGAAKLAPSALPLRFIPGERVALVGNSLAERMNLFGNFESLLHARFPEQELVVRNFARPADEVANRQRSSNYTVIDDPLSEFGPDTFLCFFGFNEAFAGEAGEEEFRKNYEAYLDETIGEYPRDESGAAPRFVLISPIAWEPTGNPLWPDAGERNRALKRYSEIVAEVAEKRGLAFVDLFTPTVPLFGIGAGMQYTINGCHLNEAGDREVAKILDKALFGSAPAIEIGSPAYEKLRAAVVDKAWVHQQDYRMLNGWYVYGGRRTWDTETFPREYKKIRAMGALRDRYVWGLARGERPSPPDDSTTGELFVPETRFGNPQQDYSEPEELRYLSPEECIATMEVPEGFEVRLFASEREFPELAKPCQLAFDSRGRLWASCMPTYPQWKPGDPKPSDRLLIFEDTDGDGRADKSITFYDELQCPTGFEFWNGGVLVTDQPRLLWLKDTDGDDRADLVVHLLDGWATDDTHHTVGAFEFSHGGLLHMLEGVAMNTTVETPWGPHRNRDTPGAHVLDPRTLKVRHFVTPGYGNPWCYVFTPWGQGIVGDGTGGQQHWDSPLSGAQFQGRRGFDPIFDNRGMRPVVGSEFLISRHLPDEVQGQFTYACVINMNGLPRFSVNDDSAGFSGERLMRAAAGGEGRRSEVPDDLIRSSDKNFRPVDPQIGPDGALWFGDWCNALIGHMQYSQRDPNRDKDHGRIYRLVHKDRPLLEPVTQHGKSERELLEQLREYEPRTRYRARRELRDRETPGVLSAISQWLAAIDPSDPEYDRLRCEALWVQQSHHAVDEALLAEVLQAKSPDARAAAIHLVADEREYLRNPFGTLVAGVEDDHPRVRLEAIRGLSFFPTVESAESALAALDKPMDSWLTYTLEHTIGALEPAWSDAFAEGNLAGDNERARRFIEEYAARQRPGLAARGPLRVVLDPDAPHDKREQGYKTLENLGGNASNGQAVFQRVCAACHKVGDAGYDFGPNLTDVAKRLTHRDLIESIVEPSKKLDPKYITTSVVTTEGKVEIGFIAERNADSLTLLQQEGKRLTLPLEEIDEEIEMKQSSMPENLGSSISSGEFLDVIEYLSTLKGG